MHPNLRRAHLTTFPVGHDDPTLADKLFFTKLPFFQDLKHLVDVGSGPLALVAQRVADLKPGLKVECIDRELGSGWETVVGRIGLGPGTAFLFSSVIHEMFSLDGHYGKPRHRDLWDDIASTKVEYVIVRDMAFNCPEDFEYSLERAWHGARLVAQHTEIMAELGVPARYTNEVNQRMRRDLMTGDARKCSKAIARETLMLLMQGRWGDEASLKEYEENYFALHPKKFDEAANIHGYSPVFFRLYNPEGVLSPDQLQGTAANGFTTHLQAVYKRDT